MSLLSKRLIKTLVSKGTSIECYLIYMDLKLSGKYNKFESFDGISVEVMGH